MELLLLILLPLLGALAALAAGRSSQVKNVALVMSLLSLALTGVILARFVPDASVQFLVNYEWIYSIGAYFKAGIDGINIILVLLTNLLVPLIILSTRKHTYSRPGVFYALILFMQAGLLTVFTAFDAFLFYVGWEAALIPIWFICALWGGENRIRVNLKFFIYTFSGSIVMLLAIIYLGAQTASHTFDLDAIYALDLDARTQAFIFLAFFLAFAIKMPLFPLHTWQPDTYTEAPTQGTMMLSGIMLKMGIFGVIRWLIPVAPLAFAQYGKWAFLLAICGIIFGSLIAFTQKNIKRLIAYSSIGHVGLIAAGIFAWNVQGLQGGIIQMLNHGINVVGLFLAADILINRLGTADLDVMGGIAKRAPKLAILFFIIVAGTVALPVTNGFIGEFLLLMGVYQHDIVASAVAGLTIIFGAVYMLRMYQKSMLGATNERTAAISDIAGSELFVLAVLCVLVVAIGVYPKPLLHLSEAAATHLVDFVNSKIQVAQF